MKTHEKPVTQSTLEIIQKQWKKVIQARCAHSRHRALFKLCAAIVWLAACLSNYCGFRGLRRSSPQMRGPIQSPSQTHLKSVNKSITHPSWTDLWNRLEAKRFHGMFLLLLFLLLLLIIALLFSFLLLFYRSPAFSWSLVYHIGHWRWMLQVFLFYVLRSAFYVLCFRCYVLDFGGHPRNACISILSIDGRIADNSRIVR